MTTHENAQDSSSSKWITPAVWSLGIALQLFKPLLISKFSLNTDLFMVSVVSPVWAFMLVCLLAGWLRLFRKIFAKMNLGWRIVFALASAVVFMLPQADLIMVFRESGTFPHYIDPLRYILLWVVPLVFYSLPALVVVMSWIGNNRLVSTFLALGIALCINGLVYVPFGLWLNRVMPGYIQP